MWNKEKIHALLDANPVAVQRAIVAIFKRQTGDEKVGGYTRHTNHVGFSKFDAEFLTSLAQQIEAGRALSAKQLAVGRNKIKRYHRQLVEIANANPKAQQAREVDIPPAAGIEASAPTKVAPIEPTICNCEYGDGEDVECRGKTEYGCTRKTRQEREEEAWSVRSEFIEKSW